MGDPPPDPDGTSPYRGEGAAPPLPPFGHAAEGNFIDERYRVERRLEERGGESVVYLCQDHGVPADNPEKQVVVKLYLWDLRPKDEVIERIGNLSHRDLIRILHQGFWNGSFFEVMEYCRGGSMTAGMPYSTDRLRALLPQMVAGLDFCHQMGVIHRDVKPTNLLFRDTGREDLVLADFGISSYSDASLHEDGAPTRFTESHRKHTLDYAAPELLGAEGRPRVSRKSDYYGLGITLLHLLTGRSPFDGYILEGITAAHLTNRIPVPEDLDDNFRQLIMGLTQFNSDNRWGLRQVQQWLNGSPMLNEEGRPWRHQEVTTGKFPFPAFKAATTPLQLARSLDKFDAARYLESGEIQFWLRYFDEALAERIAPLKDEVHENSDLALKKLAWLLDPALPLIVD